MMTNEMQIQIDSRKLEILFGQLYFSLLFSAVLFVALAYVFAEHLSIMSIISWLAIFLMMIVFRTCTTYTFNHSENISSNLQYWFLCHNIGVLLAAITWGGFILHLAISSDPTYLSLLMICAAGLCAGAAGDYSFSFPSFVIFSTPLLSPTGIFLVTTRDPSIHTSGTLCCCF